MAKPKRGGWSMKHDRELMALGKTKSLEVIADQMQRSLDLILRRAAKLGLKIKRANGAGR
jgi:hypothetical protein